MGQSEPLRAEWASDIVKKREIDIQKILSNIQNAAENGMVNIKMIDVYFPPECISIFLKLGYSISQFVDSFGCHVTKISWL